MKNNKIGCFISIPKNASKSILNILDLGKNRDNDEDEKIERFVIYENHQRLQILENKYNLENLFVFCFVRNPYDRIVSWFEYHKHIYPYNSMTFENWIYNECPHHFVIQNKTNWKDLNITPLLQCNFIKGMKKIDFIDLEGFYTYPTVYDNGNCDIIYCNKRFNNLIRIIDTKLYNISHELIVK